MVVSVFISEVFKDHLSPSWPCLFFLRDILERLSPLVGPGAPLLTEAPPGQPCQKVKGIFVLSDFKLNSDSEDRLW